MSVFGKISEYLGLETRGNSLNNPTVSLTSPTAWSQWLSNSEPTASGEIVDELTALQLVTVYACVRVIAESVAGLPCRLWEQSDKGRQEAVNNPIHDLLLVSPNPEMSAFSFWQTIAGSLALTGNAYCQIQRDAAGEPVALWPLQSRLTEPVRMPGGMLAYRTSDGETNGNYRIIPSADVIAVPLFSLDGLRGLSPIQQARQTLGLARAAEKFGARFFGGGARPGGILTAKGDIDEGAMDAARVSWQSSQGGANQGRTAVLPGDWTYTQVSLSPEEAQFLGTREYTRQDICGLFRVPPHMVGDPSRLSDNNQSSANLSFVQDCLFAYVHAIEAEVQRKLLQPGYSVKFDVSERLRSDLGQTMAAIALGRQWSILTTNEAREMLGLDPISDTEGGSIILQPINMTNLAKPSPLQQEANEAQTQTQTA